MSIEMFLVVKCSLYVLLSVTKVVVLLCCQKVTLVFFILGMQ